MRIGQYDVRDGDDHFRYNVTKVMKKTAEVQTSSRYKGVMWEFDTNDRFSIRLLLALTKEATFTPFEDEKPGAKS
tara:strand:- start:24 stop:248 length:225 start_codon:yes stop_codon:yes gene_type:complete